MVKMSVYYRFNKEAYFDHDYYQIHHYRLTKSILGQYGLVRLELDRCIASAGGGVPTFVAVTHCYFETYRQAQDALVLGCVRLMVDLPNYTNITPELILSEISSSSQIPTDVLFT